MKVLITGAAGFIGNALACRLEADGHEVSAIIRDGLTEAGETQVTYGDLRDLPTIERAMVYFEPDAVFHLAAQAIVPYAKRDPWGTFEDNVRGTYNLLEAFRRHHRPGAVCVVASSDKAYGELTDRDPRLSLGGAGDSLYDERDPLAGRGPYDCSKSCTDLIAQSYAHEYDLRIAVVRAGNVYGPGDTHSTRLVPSIVDDIVMGRPPTIQSDGRPVRDYLYIDDAVEGYLAVSRYLQNEGTLAAFNFSGGEAVSVRQLVALADQAAHEIGLAPNEEPIVLGKRLGEIRFQALNTHLARNLLRWSPKVSLLDGLRRTIRAAAVKVGRISLQSDGIFPL